AGNNSGADRAHCSMKLRTRSASCQMSSYCCWVIGMTICLAPRGTCVERVFRSRSTCRVFGRASILASPSLERSRMTKMPPAGYPAFLQYLQSGRVREIECHPAFGNPDLRSYAQSKRAYAQVGARLMLDQGFLYRHIVPSAFRSQMGPGAMSGRTAAAI